MAAEREKKEKRECAQTADIAISRNEGNLVFDDGGERVDVDLSPCDKGICTDEERRLCAHHLSF